MSSRTTKRGDRAEQRAATGRADAAGPLRRWRGPVIGVGAPRGPRYSRYEAPIALQHRRSIFHAAEAQESDDNRYELRRAALGREARGLRA